MIRFSQLVERAKDQIQEQTVAEVKARMDAGDAFVLIDVTGRSRVGSPPT